MEDRFHVLVVDDDPSTRELLSTYLDVGGVDAIMASSGEEALRILEGYRPELIISDVNMGEMDGFELCRRVRAGGLDDVPFIFVSGLGSLPDRIKGLKVGADDYLPKPVDPEELILKVTTLIERNRKVLSKLEQAERLPAGGVMRGQLGEIEITSLLQLFDLAGAEEVQIRVRAASGTMAEIYAGAGRLRHVSLGELSGESALFRVLQIDEGEFRVERKGFEGEPTMNVPIQRALLDAAAKMDEYRRLVGNPGSESERFRLDDSVELSREELDEPTARILELVDERGDLDDILTASPLSELETLRIMVKLRRAGAIREEG